MSVAKGRIALLSFSAIAVLLLFGGGVAVFLAQSDWFRERVRERIVSELETATGGQAEIGNFRFDWQSLTAEVDHLVVHGKEAAGERPLASIQHLRITLRIISLLQRQVHVQDIGIEQPEIHLIFYPGGGTNIPEPKLKRTSSKSTAETVLDLKIDRLALDKGVVLADWPKGESRRLPFQVNAGNVQAKLNYLASEPRYSGDFSASPVRIGDREIEVKAALDFEKDRLLVRSAAAGSRSSRIEIDNGILRDFQHPVATADIVSHVSIREAGDLFHWPTHQSGVAVVKGHAVYKSLQDFEFHGEVHSDSVQFRMPSGSFAIRDARVDTKVVAGPEKVDLEAIEVRALGGTITGRGEIREWNRFSATGHTNGISLRRGASTFTKYRLPYDAREDGTYQVSGELKRIARTVATAHATLTPAAGSIPVNGSAEVKYDGTDQSLSFANAVLILPHTQVRASGILNRRLDVDARTTDPQELVPLLNNQPQPVKLQNGSAAFTGTIEGSLTDPVIRGHGELTNAVYEQQLFDTASADVTAQSSSLKISNGRITHAGFSGQLAGTVALAAWKVTGSSAVSGQGRLDGADITRLLAILKQKDFPLQGTLFATATVSGTVDNPRVSGSVRASHGALLGEPFDTIRAQIESPAIGSQSARGEVIAGSRRASVTARFDHPSDRLLPGNLTFEVESNRVSLAQFAAFHRDYPSASGFATLAATGAMALSENAGLTHYRFSRLDGDLKISGFEMGGRALGDADISAVTRNNVLTAQITSNLVQSSVQGNATVRLSGDYPVDAHVAFTRLDLETAWKLANPRAAAGSFNVGGTTEGVVTMSGALAKPDQFTGTLQIPRLELKPLPSGGTPPTLQSFVLKNAGPLRISLSKGVVHMDEVRFEAPSTDLAITGNVRVAPGTALDLRAQGNVNLQMLDGFSPELTSTGALKVNAALRGNFSNPDFSGRAELSKGEMHFADFSNGLSNANGIILFNGSRATIQSLTAESGGGAVNATGFLAVTNGVLAFNLETRARQVRVRYPEGVSTVADANITLAGTSQRSQASGQVRIRRLTINPKSGVTGVITSAAEPVRTPSASNGLLANLNLDVQIETAPDVSFQTSLAQTIQAEASLRLRGTATNPALLGRINVTEGEIVFFGNKYTVTQGTISFFNPVRVEPVLNVDLETKARGVQIIITVSGPLDKPLNVTYRSDPPLQFSDILALLATGRSPTDPSIALRDTSSNQSLQQLGASALLGQAIANPVSGRLQRFFGVSKLKIDPQLSGITGSPQARLTLEQQVTPDILFTYITDVSSTSTQLIRVEWALNKTWSAIMTREENGYVGLDFAYKKRFK